MLRTLALFASLVNITAFSSLPIEDPHHAFNRVSTFLVCTQLDATCATDTETVAEIVVVSEDGMTAIYSNSEYESVGFVDISDPSMPVGMGEVLVGGEPTSVAVAGNYVLVGVNTSPDYVNASGELKVIEIASHSIVRTLDVGGQPDAVAVSPDGMYAAVAIENERDEDLGDGLPPQMPAGFLQVIHMSDPEADSWPVSTVYMTGLDGLMYDTDPEPEFVAINDDNLAVVTLQENNAIVLVDLPSATVRHSFSAGAVDLPMVDTIEDSLIYQTDSLSAVPREPDGVTWIDTTHFATADEGDANGGSRGFTIFNVDGTVVYTSGDSVEHIAAALGHYPEERSENKGTEPENVFFGEFHGTPTLFVNLERASLCLVYDVTDLANPVYKQALPTGVGPEGGVAVPSRGLVVVAAEKDSRDDKMRSSLMIYALQEGAAAYPTTTAADRADGTPIPYAALSGLAAGPGSLVYTIEDSFYKSNRILEMDTSTTPATISREMHIMDSSGLLAGLTPRGNFSADDIAAMVNADGTVNIDPEGIAVVMGADGVTIESFIVASEGSGTIGDADRPIETLNLLLKTDASGNIEQVIELPDAINNEQLRFGFEGVAYDYSTNTVVVAFQRAWGNNAHPYLGMYDMAAASWSFAFYPLDAAESQNGGWVGLSDIAPLGDMTFLVLERDNQGGPDAAIKRVYHIDLSAVTEDAEVEKYLVVDLMAAGYLPATNGIIFEKMEGLTTSVDGTMWLNNDNDGVDDNSGETALMGIPHATWSAGLGRRR